MELYGIGVDVSSEEEDELNILSDVSLDESDYPLHNDALLSALYLDQPPRSDAAMGPEKSDLVSLQAGEKDLQMEERSAENPCEKSEKLVDENEPSSPTKNETFKLSSKLTEEQQQSVAAAVLPSDPQEVSESVTSGNSQRSKEKADSLTTLSSYFVKGQGSLEAAIVSAIGLEKLTRLGRVSSARITVGNLQIEPSFAKEILICQQEKKRTSKSGSSIPLPVQSTKRYSVHVHYTFKQSKHCVPGLGGVRNEATSYIML